MKEQKGRKIRFYIYMPLVCLMLGMLGITGCFASAFGIPFPVLPYTVGIVVCCVFWAVFYRIRMEGIYRFLAFLAAMMAGSLLLLILQNVVIEGFLQIANAITERMNICYHTQLTLYQVQDNPFSTMICMFFLLYPLTGIMAFGVLYCKNVWYHLAIVFPILALIFLAGGTAREEYLFMVFISLVMEIVANVPDENTDGVSEGVRGRLMLSTWVCLSVLSLLAYFMVLPFLKIPVGYLNEQAVQAENGALQMIWRTLPQLSGGRLQLQVEGSAGGVDEGELRETKGYYFGKMKALEVTCSEKPEESIYLKGYIGTVYTGESFEETDAEQFGRASALWGIEENPSLYIQNLPFLRMLYQENVSFQGEDEEEPQLAEEISTSAMEITVKNLNANTAYTYVPYCAYLNPYYQMQSGDGAVSGQELYDDSFSFYPLEGYKQAMNEWEENQKHEGSLDRIESSYESYVRQTCLQVPETGLETLKDECLQMEDAKIEDICDFVTDTLSKECVFSTKVENPPEKEDFVSWFLYHDKKGYSTHFAAAATMMFRFCGVPARYVVGYAVPESIFMAQPDGTCKAVVEDDNAHAWTEIYLSGVGWVPIETTPGYVSKLVSNGEITQGQQTESSKEEEMLTEETATAGHEEKEEKNGALPGLVIGGLGILLMLGMWIRHYVILQKRMGKSKRNTTDNLKQVYHSLYCLLSQYGEKTVPGCSDMDFAEYVSVRYPVVSKEEMEQIAQSVLHAYYGEEGAKEEELMRIREAYLELAKAVSGELPFQKRMIFYLWNCYL